MAAYVGMWLAAAPMPYIVPIAKEKGLFNRVRTQAPDGKWRESYRVLTYPHMSPYP